MAGSIVTRQALGQGWTIGCPLGVAGRAGGPHRGAAGIDVGGYRRGKRLRVGGGRVESEAAGDDQTTARSERRDRRPQELSRSSPSNYGRN